MVIVEWWIIILNLHKTAQNLSEKPYVSPFFVPIKDIKSYKWKKKISKFQVNLVQIKFYWLN